MASRHLGSNTGQLEGTSSSDDEVARLAASVAVSFKPAGEAIASAAAATGAPALELTLLGFERSCTAVSTSWKERLQCDDCALEKHLDGAQIKVLFSSDSSLMYSQSTGLSDI